MKNPSRHLSTLTALAAFLLSVQLASSQYIWMGTNNLSASTNWSDSANWSLAAAPDFGDVRFFDEAAAVAADIINNVVDAAFASGGSFGTISSLQYGNTNGFHTTLIQPGATLTINGAVTVGTGTDNGNAQVVNATITGPGAALVMNASTANLSVHQGSSTASGTQRATLNLSGLDTFTASVNQLQVGVQGVTRPTGTLLLARTNFVAAAGGIVLGNASSDGTPTGNFLYLGVTNALFANSVAVGGRKAGVGTLLAFNPAFLSASPVALFRAADGFSRVATWTTGDNLSGNSGSNQSAGTNDFTGGAVDASVDIMYLGRGQNSSSRTPPGVGRLTFDQGIVDVNTLYAGFHSVANGASAGIGTIDVNGTARLIVNSVLELGHITPSTSGAGAGNTRGSLNIFGGTVMANTIAVGTNISANTIVLFGGTLLVTNTVGANDKPVNTFALTNGTLQLTVPAIPITNVVVSALSMGGAANTINIELLPAISGYPVRFALIKYATFGGAFNLGVGTLPPGTPAYQGYVTNNTSTSTIDLVITAGPLPPAVPLTWTGNANGDWDLASTNWLNGAVPGIYQDGSPVKFDDTAVTGTVNLTAPFAPSQTTVSNQALAYTFTGSGRLGGAGGLAKRGSGTLVIENNGGNDYSGGTTISGGVLQVGNGATVGSLGGGGVTNNAALVFNRSDNLTVTNTVSGTGSIAQNGSGMLTLAGLSSYTGPTFINAGALVLNGVLSGGGLLTNAVGTTLSGNGTNTGPVQVSGQLAPGTSAGTLAAGGLTLDPGATLTLDVNANNTVGGGVNDLIQVNGNLTLNDNAITLNLLAAPRAGVPYRIAAYSGALSGIFNPTVTIPGGSHSTPALDYSTANQVNLTFSSFASLKWNSTVSGEWDAGISPNWSNLVSGVTPDFFYAGDTVLFDDEPFVITTINLGTGVAVLPAAITVDSTNNPYSITGAGKITGATGLLKKGDSTLILGTSNDFTGPVVVKGGGLQLASVAAANFALGAASVPTFVTNGATLDLFGFGSGAGTRNLGAKQLVVSGAGYLGQGAINNSAGRSDNAVALVTLAGDATLGAAGTVPTGWWNIRGQNGDPALARLSTGGNPWKLTKVGASRLSLFNVTVDPALGDIDLQQGELDLGDNTTGLGNPASNLVVAAGATLSFFANSGATTSRWDKVFLLNGDGFVNTVNIRGGSGHVMIGPVTLSGACVLNIGGGSLTNSGPVSGTGSLIKNGGSTLSLAGTNTYSGDTSVNAGTLALRGPVGISNSPIITVASGAALDASARPDASLNLVGGQLLKGNGTVRGGLRVGLGGTVAPGEFGVGALSVTGAVLLQGTTEVEIDKLGATNDLIHGAASITYGGTLQVTSLTDPLADGDGFQLFSATTYGGAFTNFVPATPGAGLVWDTSRLTVDGRLLVSVPRPRIGFIALDGTNAIISGTGGLPGGSYYVLTSTNVALPAGNWTRLATNLFDATGSFNLTNTVVPNVPQQFYLLQLP